MDIVYATGWLALLAGIGFVQDMAFTASSRSRNSGDPNFHRWVAYASNGVWFFCHFLVWKSIWGALATDNYGWLIVVGIVYSVATAEGSVAMMKFMLRTEKGKRKAGANEEGNPDSRGIGRGCGSATCAVCNGENLAKDYVTPATRNGSR